METNIKWCTYGAWGKYSPSFIGKLIKQEDKVGYIQYTQGQTYPLECWDMDFVEVFDNLEEAIIYMMKYSIDDRYLRNILETIKSYFPLNYNEINFDLLRKIEKKILETKRNYGNKF